MRFDPVVASGVRLNPFDYTASATVDDYGVGMALWADFAHTYSVSAKPHQQEYQEILLRWLTEQVRQLFMTAYTGAMCPLPSTSSVYAQDVRVPARRFPFVRHLDLVSSPSEGLRFNLDDFIDR